MRACFPMRAAFAVLLIVGALTGCQPSDGKPAEKAAAPVPVVVAAVRRDDFATRVEALGTAKANESIVLTAKVTETVDKVLFQDGQRVPAGELLVKLSSAQEQAELEEAEVDLAEQEREARRLSGLVKQKAISQFQLDEQLSKLDAAKARLAAARARVEDRRISAPFAGVVGIRRVSPGGLVEPGDVIATLDDISIIKLDFSVSETFLRSLRPGLTIHARSAAYPERRFEGQVGTVDSRVDPVTRAVSVRAEIPNPEGLLLPGMLLTVVLEQDLTRSLVIPEGAVIPVGDRQYVFVVNDEDKVERVEVTLGRRRVGEVEVLAGLDEGARVVTEGTLRVKPGATVTIVGATGEEA